MATALTRPAPDRTAPRSVPKTPSTPKVTCEFLREADYPLWDQLVEKSPHGTVFHSSWWLALAARSFRLLVARNEEGAVVGGIPLPWERRHRLKLLHAPALAPYLGPVFDLSGEEGVPSQLHLMRSAGEALGRAAGPFDSFRYIAGADGPDLQGFLWAGFDVRLAYTFRFSATQSLAEITRGMTRTHMQKITKAARLGLALVRDQEIQTLLDLNKRTFDRKGAAAPFDRGLVTRLWEAAHGRGQANLYIAKTDTGVPVAALFTVHDQRTTYQIVSGFDPDYPDIPGQNFVLWSAVQEAIAAGRNYDFEGSGLRGVETFYRRWGCDAHPVWRMEKAGSLAGAVAHLAMRFKDSRRLKVSSSH